MPEVSVSFLHFGSPIQLLACHQFLLSLVVSCPVHTQSSLSLRILSMSSHIDIWAIPYADSLTLKIPDASVAQDTYICLFSLVR